ncbi:MAG TPA: gamma-glutamylcyclotransferase family protein [Thermoanaerobaculia bacterium]|nr:gamma-glutamylcyclotransferase family protein [Thermoanaerobaculia bacterium]
MSSDCPTQLFVYGTLRRDLAHEMFHLLARTARFVDEARVAGRLYDLGDYPGMTLSPNGSYVKGEIYDVRSDQWERVIQRLDEYENCREDDPEPHEYRRELVHAELPSGQTVQAWAYVLNRPAQGLREIVSGDYLAGSGVPSPQDL